MKIIYKKRGEGKTTELIKLSHEKFYYIVCHCIEEVHRIEKEARKLELNIPFPATYDDFIEGRYYAPGIKGFLIDNADMLLEYLSQRVPIGAITLTKK